VPSLVSPGSVSRRCGAVIVATAIAGALSGCQGTPGRSPGGAGSTRATASAHATSMNQQQQETERLLRERDRLRSELSTPGKNATEGASPSSGTESGHAPAVRDPAALQASFERLAAQLGGVEGLAVAAIGGGPATGLGSWKSGVGWSTVKVPVAVAAVAQAQDRPDAGTRRLMRLALTASDNAAAEQLWAGLGDPRSAAAHVQAVLRSAGDAETLVQSQRVRPGFTAFGQTSWSLANQATFMAALPCLRHSQEVLGLMGEVEADQRWGIGAMGLPAQFKGGWGPGLAGGYLVRQMGIVTLKDGSRVGLAIASEPADGRFETGAANLTALARWAAANIRTTAPGGC
jgi:hypothetical protein